MCLTNSVHFLSFSEALLDFMQHLPVSFCIFVLKPFRNQCKVAVNNDMHSNVLLTTKCVRRQCIYHLYQTEFVARRKCVICTNLIGAHNTQDTVVIGKNHSLASPSKERP